MNNVLSRNTAWIQRYHNELYHHGVKGMKWGVRRTREQLEYARQHPSKIHSTGVRIKTVYGHSPAPVKAGPNDIIDHVREDGKVDARSFYDTNGIKAVDIHTTAHGNRKRHNFGSNGEHVDMYYWSEDGYMDHKELRELTPREREENSDIL